MTNDHDRSAGRPGLGEPDPGGDRPTATFEGSEGMELVYADDLGEPTRTATVAGVVLAAGSSSRFDGRNKLLAELDGEPLARHAARSLVAADVTFDPLVAVVGHEADRVRPAFDGLGVDVVENPDYDRGQSTSLRAGLDRARDADAALFALADMPFVLPRSVEGLVEAYCAGAGDALAAAYTGRRGNPVLFGRRHFDALADVEGDTGGRDVLLEGDDSALVETGDPGVLVDIDEPADLAEYRRPDPD